MDGSIENYVAVLIDGENLSHEYFGQIEGIAKNLGTPNYIRVFGNVKRIPKWDEIPGVRTVHTGTGKNSADIALVIEAVDLVHSRRFGAFVIATSDQDYAHLAIRLRENCERIVGIGEKKSPERFRKSCSSFNILNDLPKPDPVVTITPLTLDKNRLHNVMATSIKALSDPNGWADIAPLGALVWSKHKISKKAAGQTSWSKFLVAHSDRYQVDSKTSPPRVKLKK